MIPAWVGNNTFGRMKSIIFNARVGNNVAIGISSIITGGVTIPDNKYVPLGSIITKQNQADLLLERIGSPYEKTNKVVIDVNTNLSKEYQKLSTSTLTQQKEIDMEKMIIAENQ